MPKDFDEIQLTQEQIDDLIYEQRCNFYFEAKKIQAKNITANERIEAKRQFTAEELSDFILKENPSLKLDEYSKPIFEMFCFYFSRDKRFEECGEGFSLYKSIALVGSPGRGKTTIMEAFQRNKRQCFYLIDMNRVQEDCRNKAQDNIDYYKTFTSQVPGWGYNKNYFYQEQLCWCIDDIGKEEVLNDYGNKAYVFSKIIQFRSSNKQLLQYFPMHITSMLTADQIEAKYGEFVRSRMREQFNWIQYDGVDRRK